MSDPRVFFAAERTLLAWIRTGLTVMGFGFVVARFGLFLKLVAVQHIAAQAPINASPFSSIVGITLVVVGAATLAFAGTQHRKYVAALPSHDIPAGYRTALPEFLAYLLGLLGVSLAVYLALGAG
jgi:putative membrane protein